MENVLSILDNINRSRLRALLSRTAPENYWLITHAAFPVALTSDLLYKIWVNFRPKNPGNVAGSPVSQVSQILLSPICKEISRDIYEIYEPVKSGLLGYMRQKDHLGPARIEDLARFLSAYVDQCRNKISSVAFAEAQRWTADAYIRPERAAESLLRSISEGVSNNWSSTRIHYYISWAKQLGINTNVEANAANSSENNPLITALRLAEGVELFNEGNTRASFEKFESLKHLFEPPGTVSAKCFQTHIPRVVWDKLDISNKHANTQVAKEHEKKQVFHAVAGIVAGLKRYREQLEKGTDQEVISPLQVYAIIVSVENYRNQRSFKGAIENAEKFYEWLIQEEGVPGENIKLLTTSQGRPPTEDNIRRAFENLMDDTSGRQGASGRLIVYLAGMGTYNSNRDFFLLSEANEHRQNKIIDIQDLFFFIRKSGFFKEIVIFYDLEQYKGVYNFLTMPAFILQRLRQESPNQKYLVIGNLTGRPLGEMGSSEANAPYGHFTKTLLEGLNGMAANAERKVTAQSIRAFVEYAFPRDARIITPVNEDFIIAVNKTSAVYKDSIEKTALQESLQYAPTPKALLGGDQWHVFISYPSVHRPWVVSLFDVLETQGFRVFLDFHEVKAGDNIVRILEEGLEKSQNAVLIWSDRVQDSKRIYREYQTLESQTAYKKDFHFIPVKLDKTELPSFARDRTFLDFSSYPDGPNGGELLRLLYAVAGQTLSSEAVRFAVQLDEQAIQSGLEIEAAIRNRRPESIIELFERNGLPWKINATLGCKAAEGLIKLNHYDDAVRLLEILRGQFPKSIRPKQLLARSLLRRDAEEDVEKAQEILSELHVRGELDADTLGLYARTWMDRYSRSGDSKDLRQSRNLYAEAFEKAPDDYYLGINVAAKSVLLGGEENLEQANAYAQKVQAIIENQVDPGDYWKTVTLAEAALIQRKYEEAGRLYKQAVDISYSDTRSHSSTFKEAMRVMQKMRPTKGEAAFILFPFNHLPEAGDPDEAGSEYQMPAS